jgi:hypothetical protein
MKIKIITRTLDTHSLMKRATVKLLHGEKKEEMY